MTGENVLAFAFGAWAGIAVGVMIYAFIIGCKWGGGDDE